MSLTIGATCQTVAVPFRFPVSRSTELCYGSALHWDLFFALCWIFSQLNVSVTAEFCQKTNIFWLGVNRALEFDAVAESGSVFSIIKSYLTQSSEQISFTWDSQGHIWHEFDLSHSQKSYLCEPRTEHWTSVFNLSNTLVAEWEQRFWLFYCSNVWPLETSPSTNFISK